MTTRLIHWLRSRISSRIVQDVPEEVAACEFECRKAQCLHDEWDNCPNRKSGEAKVA